MHLWTEYVGHAIDGRFPLRRLLRSEGRNAFFLSTDGSGADVVVRLTESLNDESELAERWSRASVLKHPHLQRLAQPGRTTVDNVPLAYVLLEPADAALADVLTERPLTVAETTEVALAVTEALIALHAAGLIHEHVRTDNVFAVGETVKLRSDCVRECTADFENDTEAGREELRRRDAQDLGRLLAQCLSVDTAGTLPARFQRVVPGLISGEWTLHQAMEALPVRMPAQAPPPAVPGNAAPVVSRPSPVAVTNPIVQQTLEQSQRPGTFRQRPNRGTAQTGALPLSPAVSSVPPAVAKSAAAVTSAPTESSVGSRPNHQGTRRSPVEAGVGEFSMGRASSLMEDAEARLRAIVAPGKKERPLLRYGLGAAAVVLLGIGIHHWENAPEAPATRPAAAPQIHSQHAASSASAAGMAQTILSAAERQPGWRVIAYTYNHEEQARAKVLALQREHFGLQPQVFSPTGGAPFFVALGGPADRGQADSLRQQARRAGLPRDTYIRNF